MPQLKKLYAKISPKRIAFLKFILEGYDNIAMLSTVNRDQGLILLRYPQELKKDVISLLEDIDKQIFV